jgi:four helix bundle protein
LSFAQALLALQCSARDSDKRQQIHSSTSGVDCARHKDILAARRFEKLRAWQLSMELSDLIYEITEDGPCVKDFEFRSQFREAAEAAAPLIAEGFIRFTPDEFVRYLRMARGEIAEVRANSNRANVKNTFAQTNSSAPSPLRDTRWGVTTARRKPKS